MIVGAEHVGAIWRERVALGHELDGGGRVGGEAHDVFRLVGAEVREQARSREVEGGGALPRRPAVGVGISQHGVGEQLVMRSQLARGGESTAGVVEIREAVLIEAGELAIAEFSEERVGSVQGERRVATGG